ncbi:hypothetical protein J9303_11715 [Bacillaceae bacterium Marseille-Q3522]|nr:hypothetical protein [Bacillaceae bacterium Marseille-Q3522]
MTKSKARKYREKQVREGQFDVTMKRGSWGDLSPVSRKTKTKHEQLIRLEKKYKKNHTLQKWEKEYGPFFVCKYFYLSMFER